MKQKLIIILVAAMLLPSCMRDRFPAPGGGADENREVEILLDAGAKTRAEQSEGTPDERVVADLDLLVFDADGFRLWRSAYKVDDRFRATLPVSRNLNVYFVANCRHIITAISDADGFTAGLTWEQVRLKLIDDDPSRLVVASGFRSLPMWGRLLGQTVEDLPVNRWNAVSLMRAVASTDVYVNPAVDNFTLADLRLYFVPDRGLIAPSDTNYDESGPNVDAPESPAGMSTASLVLHSDRYDAANLCIANKLYLYDNDTHSGNRTLLPDRSRRHTRLVVGGEYEGNTYYYPVDFATPYDSLDRITRNWKYIFTINSVSSRGYTDPETASTEPMIGLDVNIVNWNVDGESDFWVSGPYYLGIDKRTVTLSRPAGSAGSVAVRSNILSDNIGLEFKTAANGLTVATGTVNDGIANSRFRIEKIADDGGYITGLKITALGDHDPAVPSRNGDVVVLTSGRIRVEITINQIEGNDTDWDDGGEVGNGDMG